MKPLGGRVLIHWYSLIPLQTKKLSPHAVRLTHSTTATLKLLILTNVKCIFTMTLIYTYTHTHTHKHTHQGIPFTSCELCHSELSNEQPIQPEGEKLTKTWGNSIGCYNSWYICFTKAILNITNYIVNSIIIMRNMQKQLMWIIFT